MDEILTPERFWCDAIELRASPATSKGPGTLAGYAIKWNSLSQPLKGGIRETFKPRAFGPLLVDSDVLAVTEHGEGARNIYGRSTAGTLRLNEDDVGLNFENDLPDTSAGRDLAVQVARGDIRGVSVAFIPTKVSWDEVRSDMPTRVVHEAKIHHLSYEARPAYRDTSVALRSLEAARAEATATPPAITPEATPIFPASPDLSLAKARLRLAEAES